MSELSHDVRNRGRIANRTWSIRNVVVYEKIKKNWEEAESKKLGCI